jgi:hemerythrin-like domain-containing protein
MHPTRALVEEHEVILSVLDCLDRMVQAAEQGRGLDRAAAAQALDFLRTFADTCHHGKEEELLFPLLERRGLPRHAGPLAVMLAEHEAGRALIRRMVAAIGDPAAPPPARAADFAPAASAYVELLREHIAKENGVLFPMAESMLRSDDAESLEKAFERTEREHLGAGTHERYLAIANALCERFGVQPRATAPIAGGCGHGPRGCGH